MNGTYIMWVELGRSLFLYVTAVSNALINGNGTGTKNVLNGFVHFGFRFSIQSSVFGGATTLCKHRKQPVPISVF